MAYKKILVPVDGSATSNLGLREAIKLAKEQGASIHLVHVVDEHYVMMGGLESAGYTDDMFKSMRAEGRRVLEKAVAAIVKEGLRAKTTLVESMTSPVADVIVREARKVRPDVIVIGTHGRRGVRRLVMGSDAEQVVRASTVPVLLVRGKEAAARKRK